MSKKKERRGPSPARASLSFWRNLTSGDYGPVERARRAAANLMRRNLQRRIVCCGNYGDPGC